MTLTEDRRTQAVERWGDMVYRLALARTASVPDAEDVFQEVFLRYFRHEDRFQTGLDMVGVVRASSKNLGVFEMQDSYLHLCGLHKILKEMV